ncbi:hypothetical protein EON64_12820 [archaeon]|nr:MAG: hypothetical protein EON64_12820 [archaeon]
MLERVEHTLYVIAAEKQRLLEEERRARDECVREALRQKRLEAARIQERLRHIGRCPMNFEWIPQNGGYRCAGGSHFVSASQINYVD